MQIKRSSVIALLAAAVLAGVQSISFAASPVDDVNVFIGTGGHGHTYPGATVPFGFVQLSPDTRREGWDGCSGYHYTDSTILGFSHTHLSGTGCGDLGDILLLPLTGDLQSAAGYKPLDCERFKSEFSHDKETASPGVYSVRLDRYGIQADLTATAHAGLHRYTFPKDQAGHVLLDLVHGIGNHVTAGTVTADSDHRLSGSRTTRGWNANRTTYFVIEMSRPFKQVAYEVDDKAATPDGKTAKGKAVRAVLDFDTAADGASLLIRVGLSGTSVEQAAKNLETEMPVADFDAVQSAARQLWENHLSRLTIQSPDPVQRRTFYSALYHTMVAPTLYNDADGTYRGNDGQVHSNPGFANYSTLSLWDTFRAEHPLLTLVSPERVDDFVKSTLVFYEQSKEHALPMWPLAGFETHCMIGYHAVPVIYDAYAKGFRDFDANLALQAMQDTALKSPNAPKEYDQRGYVTARPGKHDQAAARTLEYSYDDWCIARMAESLGKSDVAEHFDRRALNFGNIFDSDIGFFRGRTPDGKWFEPLDPKAINFENYTEANAWQYAFFVPHDVPTMMKLYGGPEAFVRKLDECFDQESDMPNGLVDVSGLMGMYSQGNEPCHHVPYLYALAGAQDKTARRVHQIMRMQYDDTPQGLSGNDDCGQMSAWYVWSAMGLYPVNPADGRYIIGSPAVPSATLKLDSKYAKGQTFTVNAHNLSNQNIYIKSAKLNGKALDRPWVTHEEVTGGGTLDLEMSMLPTRLWAKRAHPPQVTVDTSKFPDMKAFGENVQKTADEWYPKLIALMRPNDPSVTNEVRITMEDKDGVAWAQNDRITMTLKWFRTHPDDLGAAVHELTHIVQEYPDGAPGWFVEGFADYTRWFIYEPKDKRPHPDPKKATYKDSYRTSAAFLNWIVENYGQATLLKVDADCRRGAYKEENWATYTGKPISQLGNEWKQSLQPVAK
ncbi:MAG: putative alpha,2-mannosidase [Phycisphaerales bacterium]|nr:putative alpha,2-mannosidase [Phycisphaerales bacterium]